MRSIDVTRQPSPITPNQDPRTVTVSDHPLPPDSPNRNQRAPTTAPHPKPEAAISPLPLSGLLGLLPIKAKRKPAIRRANNSRSPGPVADCLAAKTLQARPAPTTELTLQQQPPLVEHAPACRLASPKSSRRSLTAAAGRARSGAGTAMSPPASRRNPGTHAVRSTTRRSPGSSCSTPRGKTPQADPGTATSLPPAACPPIPWPAASPGSAAKDS